MQFPALAALLALLLVPLTRGSFRRLAQTKIQAPWLLFLGVVLQVGTILSPIPHRLYDSLGFGLLMGSYALILGFCFVNIRLRGMAIVAVGIAMNVLVIGLNQGMPYKVRHGDKPVADVKWQPKTKDDLLPFLSDIILLPKPFQVISFGDIVLSLGLIDVCFWASRKPRRRAADDDEEPADGTEPSLEPMTPTVVEAEEASAAPQLESAAPAERAGSTQEATALVDLPPVSDDLLPEKVVDLRAYDLPPELIGAWRRQRLATRDEEPALGEHPLESVEDAGVVDVTGP